MDHFVAPFETKEYFDIPRSPPGNPRRFGRVIGHQPAGNLAARLAHYRHRIAARKRALDPLDARRQ